MKPIRCTALVCLIFCTLFFLTGCGRTDSGIGYPQLPEDSFVYDEAGILRGDTKQHILKENESLLSRSGTRIAVACVRDTDGLAVSEYARQLFLEWEVGARGEETGVLLLLCPGENGYWCLQSRSLEPELSDEEIGQILRQTLEPHFAAGSYDEGVRLTVDALTDALSQPTPPPQSPETNRQPDETVAHRETNSNVLAWAVIAVLILLLILHFVLVSEKPIRRQRRRTVYSSLRSRHRRFSGTRPTSIRHPVAPPKGRPRPTAYSSRSARPNTSRSSFHSTGMRRR